jgi:argininosuccinate lyase
VLADDFRSGAFVLDERYEDGHSAIEARLIERLGDAGAGSTPAAAATTRSSSPRGCG